MEPRSLRDNHAEFWSCSGGSEITESDFEEARKMAVWTDDSWMTGLPRRIDYNDDRRVAHERPVDNRDLIFIFD